MRPRLLCALAWAAFAGLVAITLFQFGHGVSTAASRIGALTWAAGVYVVGAISGFASLLVSFYLLGSRAQALPSTNP